MKTGFRCLGGLLVSITFALAFSLRCHADGPQWLEIRSPHFSVATDAGEKRGREVAMRFEQMRAVFAILVPKASVNINIPLQIVAFRNTKELRAFAPLWQGKPTELAGLFQGGEDRSFIMLDMSVENPYQVVFHEYAHQLMNASLTHPSAPWFEEGFAEFFSSIEVDSKEARVGKIPEQTYLVLQQNGMMKTADLFRVRQNSQTYNESGDHRTVFYRQSWMVVHYIYDNQLLPKLGAYFDAISRQLPVDEAIQQGFGMSAAQFDKTMQDYVRRGQYKYFQITNPPNIVSNTFTVAPLTATEVATITADIHLHSPDYQEKAVAEFQEILKTDPNNAAANRGLGYACLRQKQFDDAKVYFHKAAQLDSKDPRVHYYSALLMSRDGSFTGDAAAEEIEKELQTAVSLDPGYADAYMLLGFTLVREQKGDPAVAAMEKAASLRPRDEHFRFNLAQVYMSNRDFDRAQAVLQALENTGNPQLAARVQQALQQVHLMKNAGTVSVRPRDQVGDASGEPADEAPRLTRRSSVQIVLPPGVKNPQVKQMRATIASVECLRPPAARMTVVSGSTTWKLTVQNIDQIMLTGADKFSCTWAKQTADFNYIETGNGEGIVLGVQLTP